MNALAYDILPPPQHPADAALPTLAVPAELATLFEESAKMKASFWRLTDRERRGFVRFVDDSNSGITRERRAVIVAMSLMGLACDLRDDGSVIPAS